MVGATISGDFIRRGNYVGVDAYALSGRGYNLGFALEYLIINPDAIFEYIDGEYRFTIAYNPENKDYIFNVYLENEEIPNFYIEDLMSTEVRWKVKTNLLSFNDAFEDAIANNKLIKHRDIDYQDFFNDYKKSEVKKMISEKAWEVF